MNFSTMVTSSVFARALALLILAITVIAAVVVGAVEILRGEPINPIVWAIVGTGLGSSLSIMHINYGVGLQTSPTDPAGKVTP